MNIVTVTTHDKLITRIPMANDDDAVNLVAFMHRAERVRHVAVDKDNGGISRSNVEVDRASMYLKAFTFNIPITG
jgi:hypothetical protein